MLSVIIPSYKDPYLQKTIDSLLDNSTEEIEIIPVIDGYKLEIPIMEDKRVKPIYFDKNYGMRASINAGVNKSHGEYIMKCDSHCHFAESFDKVLRENTQENWITIPRRYGLDDNNWTQIDKRPSDYLYLTFPHLVRGYGICLSNQEWQTRDVERSDPRYDIDDTMSFQGSCWFVNKKYFLEKVGQLDDNTETYGTFVDEPQEIGLKYWLSGGENKVIKKTWYAHLSKRPRHYHAGIFTRDYKLDKNAVAGRSWSARHWINNEEPKMIHKLSWLVEKFWPIPTWPEDRLLWRLQI